MAERDLLVKVIKAGRVLRLPAAVNGTPSQVHLDRAGEWQPEEDVRIHAVSIPEQSEISIYADIEMSTAPEMYMEEGHIFRVKYAGPALQGHDTNRPTFSGSNITNTNIVFPAGLSIGVRSGEKVYVHLDLINHSPYDVEPMTQDVYVYFSKSNADGSDVC